MSVIDGSGLSVSLTHTAANSIAGGKRPVANMGPILITRQGETVASIGAPGGRRILSAVTQVAINLIDRSMDTEMAVSAPRCDASGPDLLVSERLSETVMNDQELSKHAKVVAEQHEGFGYELARPLLAVRETDGTLSACGDPFTRNCAIGL